MYLHLYYCSFSDSDSDDEDAYEEALEEPVTKEGTLKWAERLNKRYARKKNVDSDDYSSSEQSSYYENSSGGKRKFNASFARLYSAAKTGHWKFEIFLFL